MRLRARLNRRMGRNSITSIKS